MSENSTSPQVNADNNVYRITLPITAWAEEDRPREKLLLKGKNALTDAELLAILIGTEAQQKSTWISCLVTIAESLGNLID